MLAKAFIGRTEAPAEAAVAAAMGGSVKALWDELLSALAETGATTREWTSYSPKAGWSLRLKRGKRAIVYLSPSEGAFLASFALGGKAMEVARQSGLPARALKLLEEAPRYAEGTAVRVEVKAARDVAVVKKLASIKIAN